MNIPITPEQQLEILTQDAQETIPSKEILLERLKEKKSLYVKFGIDPRSNIIHLGHLVHIIKLKKFKELGHKIIFIKGGFTAKIGDPDSADYKFESEFRIHSNEEIEKRSQYYDQVIKRILGDIYLENNKHWLESMNVSQFMELISNITLADLENRNFFKIRKKKNQPIFLPELLYSVFQAYDSLRKEADIEIGGIDQRPNMLLARQLQKIKSKPPQICILYPILEGINGTEKMSENTKNFISIEESPIKMFGKIMRIPDNLIIKYFQLLTNQTKEQLNEISQRLASENPFNIKKELGFNIMSWFYSKDEIKFAEKEFTKISKHEYPSTIPEFNVSSRNILDALLELKLVRSKKEGKNYLKDGAVRINNIKVSEQNAKLSVGDIISIGRKFAKISIIIG